MPRISTTVVVGIDFSSASRRALEVAAGVARPLGAQLDLVHAWSTPAIAGSFDMVPPWELWLGEQTKAVEARLASWARDLPDDCVAWSRVAEGPASRSLPQVARSSQAGLIVVGRRAAAGLAHAMLGSVCERVIRSSPCPVLVVPERTTRVLAPRRLLVGLDFSRASREALRAAVALATEIDCPDGALLLHVDHARRDRWLEPWSESAAYVERGPHVPEMKRWAAAEIRQASIPIDFEQVSGIPEEELIRVANREHCDWLALGVQGRTALASFLIGSTTDQILERSDLPVLVVPNSPMLVGESSSPTAPAVPGK